MLTWTPHPLVSARMARVDANTTVAVHAYATDSIVSAWWTWRRLDRQAHRFATDIERALAEVIAEVHVPLEPHEVAHLQRLDRERQAAQRNAPQ